MYILVYYTSTTRYSLPRHFFRPSESWLGHLGLTTELCYNSETDYKSRSEDKRHGGLFGRHFQSPTWSFGCHFDVDDLWCPEIDVQKGTYVYPSWLDLLSQSVPLVILPVIMVFRSSRSQVASIDDLVASR